MALFIIILRYSYSPQGRQKMMGGASRKVFIVQGKWTPFGKFGGSLAGITPVTKINPETLDQVIFATALEHQLGAPGIKITLILARLLQHFKKSYDISSACIGGGQGIALLIKRV